MVQATIGKWGNNLAVRLPGEIVDAMHLREGERVTLEADEHQVVIRPVESRVSLTELFRGKSAKSWRAEYAGAYDWGPDVGRESVPE